MATIMPMAKILIILICVAAIAILVGVYRISMRKYNHSFTIKDMRTKIMSVYLIFENISVTIVLFTAGKLIEIFNNSIACIVLAVAEFIIITIVLKYAQTRLGLKPEEYKSKDINELR